MIIWGGFNGSQLNTGGRYDPVNDSWLPTSIGTNVPSGRSHHTAIWDDVNNQMIIWGGYASPNTNTGGRYDPTNDSWQTTDTGANVHSGRNNHTAVWDDVNNQMIVWSGDIGGGNATNTGGRYDSSMDSWLSTNTGSNVPEGRYWHTAIWTGNEMIIWGGSNSSSSLNSGGRYDPSNDTWQATFTGVDVPSARYNHTTIWDTANNQMIVWGGYNGSSRLATGGRYDPITNSWQATSFGPSSRAYHTAIWDSTNNQMIIWGGESAPGDYLNTGGRYDPMTDSWQTTSIGNNVPSARYNHTTVWDNETNQMIVWGGIDGSRINTGGRYNPASDSWQTTDTGANVPSGRHIHTAIWDNTNNQMIIWGGDEGSGLANTGGRYNPIADSWQTMSMTNTPSGRYNQTSIWDTANNQMIIWGGYDGAITNTGGRYDPSADSWQTTSIGNNVPSARTSHTSIWDDVNNEMIVWGGADVANTNTGGRYNPSTDSWLTTSTGSNTPPGRSEHTAVWSGSQMYIWGGRDPNVTKSLAVYYPFIDLIFDNSFE